MVVLGKKKGMNNQWKSKALCVCVCVFFVAIFFKKCFKDYCLFFSKGAGVFNFNCLLVLEFEHPRYLKKSDLIYILFWGFHVSFLSGRCVVDCSPIQKGNQPLQLMLDSINFGINQWFGSVSVASAASV